MQGVSSLAAWLRRVVLYSKFHNTALLDYFTDESVSVLKTIDMVVNELVEICHLVATFDYQGV